MANVYNADLHHRRSLRLKAYDYSQAGAYFVTICTRNRECLFGDVADGQMQLNDMGRIVWQTLENLPGRFPTIKLGAFVVMPNHVHGIVIVGAQFIAPDPLGANHLHPVINQGVINHAPTLGEIIRTFKAVTARQIRKNDPMVFRWQRNYYEHIIRNDEEWTCIRRYIEDNPLKWEMDRENPAAQITRSSESWQV